MRESESYNRTAAVGAAAENRNRKTVVRIQSKIAYIKGLNPFDILKIEELNVIY